jgi:2-keto-4-pentenoate hydratase/2-oxohepta-3-ene-1,7-dioic acid hydratase in catechol pathway/sugar lactone lactonase YvrE
MVRTAAGEPSVAVQRGADWVPLLEVPGADRLGSARTDLLALLAAGEQAHQLAQELAAAGTPAAEPSAEPLLSLPFRPTAFRDCSLWEEHMIGVARGLLRLRESAVGRVAEGYERLARRPFPRLRPRPLWYEQPLYYKGNPATFIGDGATVRWPAYAQALDYELEIGVVIARDCSDLTREEAPGVVGGFVLLNDFSARDVQFREMVEGLMGPAKSKDFGTALGSVVVTTEEFLPVLDALTAEVHVNGELWGTGSTRNMQHSVADVIAYASAGEQLEAGTVIGLGTIPGCSGIETGRWLSPGDVVELSAGLLGRLRNPVGEPEPWRQPGPITRARWSIVNRSGEQADPQADPAPWTPPSAAKTGKTVRTGKLAPNQVLDQVERWEVPGGTRPEDVVFDPAGRLYAGVEDGRIWRWPATYPGSGHAELFADTHGRPLGLEIDPRDGTLIVCDAYRGLLRIEETGPARVLAQAYDGRALKFTNNAAVAADGTVYFSDSSTRFRIEHYKQDLLEHRPNGRVFRYRPEAEDLDLVADGLYFPNGVALAPDESFLLVAQTAAYDIVRIPLTGPAAGRPEPFASNLPGLPDNMSPAGDGSYWVAFPSPRLPLVDRMMPHPASRRIAARLPERLQPAAARYGLVARVGADGTILQSLHGPAGSYREIVGVRQHDDWLYLGSLAETAVGRIRIP